MSKYKGKYKKGDMIGRWTVVDGEIHGSPAKIKVVCVCGKERLSDMYTLINNTPESCGCLRRGIKSARWEGENSVPKMILRNAVNTSISPNALAGLFESQSGTCALTNTTLNANNSTTVTLTTTRGETTVWVNKACVPFVNLFDGNLSSIVEASNNIVKKSNIFDDLGFYPNKED